MAEYMSSEQQARNELATARERGNEEAERGARKRLEALGVDVDQEAKRAAATKRAVAAKVEDGPKADDGPKGRSTRKEQTTT